MRILVTGACGYKGTVLVPMLLAKGHEVVAVDTQWFGNFLEDHECLEIRKQNIIQDEIDLRGVDAVIHLASIANDPTGDLNPKLTWETSCLATMALADKCARSGISRFIYASSGSVYGVKEEEHVTEDLELVPISEYNKTKMVSERVLLSYRDTMQVQIVRPATVCGLSPRMRLDVSVNLLTMSALEKNKITVFGGQQIRPNIHIDDICYLYCWLIENPQHTGIFNAGFENLTILDIANMVADRISVPIEIIPSADIRSYRVNSDKLLNIGFTPKKTVSMAIDEIIAAFRSGQLKNEEKFHNLYWMQSNNLAE